MSSTTDWARLEKLMDYWKVGILDMTKGKNVSYKTYDCYADAPDEYQDAIYNLMQVAKTDRDNATRWVGNVKISLIRKGTCAEGIKLFKPTNEDTDVQYTQSKIWNQFGRQAKQSIFTDTPSTVKRIAAKPYVQPQPKPKPPTKSIGDMIDDFNDLL